MAVAAIVVAMIAVSAVAQDIATERANLARAQNAARDAAGRAARLENAARGARDEAAKLRASATAVTTPVVRSSTWICHTARSPGMRSG